MVDERQNFLFSLDVAVKTGAKHPFLPDSLQSKEPIFAVLLDEVDLPEGPLPNPLVELEAGKRDGLDLMLLLYKLVHLEDVLLPRAQLLLLLLLLAQHLLHLHRRIRRGQH